MFVVCLAELNIAIENKYDYIKEMCRDYITENKADFCVSASDEEINAESKGTCFDKGYLESLAIYRKIAEKIIEYCDEIVKFLINKNVKMIICAIGGYSVIQILDKLDYELIEEVFHIKDLEITSLKT